MRVRVKVTEGLVVSQSDDPIDMPVLLLGESEKEMWLSRDERNALVLALMGKGGKKQFAIAHPSDRLLQRNYSEEEVWGPDDTDRLVLFASLEEAEEHIAVRCKRWPKSDWPHTRVVTYTPGVKIHSTWGNVSGKPVVGDGTR